MAYSEELADRIRQALAQESDVEEKKMFGGLAFMVNGKMCITTRDDQIMCRIDPNLHDSAIKRDGCQTVIMRGSEYKGRVYVDKDYIQAEADFNYWVDLVLDFNEKAKSSKKSSS